jgi:uncharacterized protein YdaU (DUF1376 family)
MNDDNHKSSPSAFMCFYWAEFFAAVEGHGEIVLSAYVRALGHYWQVNHCAGLIDDQEFLQGLCRVPDDKWERVGAIVFGGFFKKRDGLWRQKRADKEWAKANHIFESRRAGGVAASAKRWGPKLPPRRKKDL